MKFASYEYRKIIILSMTYIPWMDVILYFICMAPVYLQGAHQKRKKMQNEKFLLTVGLEPTALRSEI